MFEADLTFFIDLKLAVKVSTFPLSFFFLSTRWSFFFLAFSWPTKMSSTWGCKFHLIKELLQLYCFKRPIDLPHTIVFHIKSATDFFLKKCVNMLWCQFCVHMDNSKATWDAQGTLFQFFKHRKMFYL